MHRSGIKVSDDVAKAINDPSNTGYLHITIANEAFKLNGSGKTRGGFEADLLQVKDVLTAKPNDAAFCFVRKQGKWVLVFFVPEKCQVKDKMLYASSRAALKEGFDAKLFDGEFYIHSPSECTLKDYEMATSKGVSEELLTSDEVNKQEALAEAMKAVSVSKVAAIADLPIKISETATKALGSAKNPGNGLILEVALDAEVVNVKHNEAKTTPEELAKKLLPKEPAYIVYNFAWNHDGQSGVSPVLVYYCPDNAPPRAKMFYSSSKSMLLKAMERLGINVQKNIELNEPKELTSELIMDELFPKKVEKVAFAKPKRVGKGEARLVRSTD